MVVTLKCSAELLKSDELSLLSEGSSGHVDTVLSDETLAGSGDSASSGVLSVLSWMTVQLLLHYCLENVLFTYNSIIKCHSISPP